MRRSATTNTPKGSTLAVLQPVLTVKADSAAAAAPWTEPCKITDNEMPPDDIHGEDSEAIYDDLVVV